MPRHIDVLIDYLNTPPQPVESNKADVAKYILGAKVPTKIQPLASTRDKDPSLLGKIFDALSTTNYAMAGFTKDWIEDGAPDLSAFGRGIQEKTTYSEALESAGMEEGFGRSALGLGLDIFADPLTYVPIAGIASKLKRGREAVEQIPQLGEQLKRADEVIDPSAFAQRGIKLPEELAQGGRPRNIEEARTQLPRAFRQPDTSIPQEDVFRGVPSPAEGPIRYAPGVDPLPGTQPAIPGLDELLPASRVERRGMTPTPVGERGVGQTELPNLNLLTPDEQKKFLKSQGYDFRTKEGRAARESLKKRGGTYPPVVPELASTRKPGQRTFGQFNKEFKEAIGNVSAIKAGNIQAITKAAPVSKSQYVQKIDNSKHTKPAQGIVDNFNWGGSKAAPGVVNGAAQMRLYHNARNAANKQWKNAPPKKKAENAFKILTEVERIAEASGKRLQIDNMDMKLSDVIMKAGGPDLADEVAKTWKRADALGGQSIVGLKSGKAIQDADKVQEIASNASDTKALTEASNMLSDPQLKDFDKFVKNFSEATAKAAGLDGASVDAVKRLTEHALKAGRPAADLATETRGAIARDIIDSGKNNPKYAKAIHHALEKDVGKIPDWAVHENKAVESIMGKVATAFGQKDLRPISLNHIASSMTTAQARGEALAKLFGPLDAKQADEVVKLAQGIGTPSSEQVHQVATQVKRMMDNLFSRATGQSVIARSAVTKTELNKWMDHYKVGFKFDDKAKGLTGESVNHWLDSWKTWDIAKDPQGFMFKLQQAVEQSVRERAVYDDLGARFGSVVRGKDFRTTVSGHPYLDGWYFPEDIAKQIPRLVKDWDPKTFTTADPMFKHYDRVLSMWKAGVTIYRPGHHIRNMSGDIYLGWMDGVNTVKPYRLAARVQRYMGGYKGLADIDRLVEVGLAPRTLSTPAAGDVLFRNKSGVEFTAEEVYARAQQMGVLEKTKTLEDLLDMGDEANKLLDIKPFGGRVQKFARSASELQNHNVRLAHVIDKLMKSKGTDKAAIFQDAVNRARKFHPTGLDLTKFEKTRMRRLIPFYSWMRKSTPLLLTGMVMNPGKTVIPAKISGAIQEAQGIETFGREDPFPVDQMFPSWIKHTGLGPVGKPDSILGKFAENMPPGYIMGGVGLNPLSDMMAQAEVPGKTALSSITPALKVPMEIAAGQEFFTGAPISGPEARTGAFREYVGQQIPGISAAQGIVGVTPFGSETRRGASTQNLVNFLTAAGIRGTGPTIDSAIYEKLQPQRQRQREQKDAFFEDLRRRVAEGGGP